MAYDLICSPALSHIICKHFLVILSSPHHYNGFGNKNKTPAFAGALKVMVQKQVEKHAPMFLDIIHPIYFFCQESHSLWLNLLSKQQQIQ